MQIFSIIIHLDQYINTALETYHGFFYLIFFMVIFCETGIVITPFLPGDSLLFLAGAFAATGQLNMGLLIIIIFLACLLGDNSNYLVGKLIGDKLTKTKWKIFSKQALAKTHNFYEKHGQKAIILARFVPIIRTFIPFIAGLGQMSYKKFITYSLIASCLWTSIFLGGGYCFGNIPVIKEHISIIILGIIVISILPFINLFFKLIITNWFKRNVS